MGGALTRETRDVEQDRWPSSFQDWQQWRVPLVHAVWQEGQGSLVKTPLPVWRLLRTYHQACTHPGCFLSECLIWQDWREAPRKGTGPPCNEAGRALALPGRVLGRDASCHEERTLYQDVTPHRDNLAQRSSKATLPLFPWLISTSPTRVARNIP